MKKSGPVRLMTCRWLVAVSWAGLLMFGATMFGGCHSKVPQETTDAILWLPHAGHSTQAVAGPSIPSGGGEPATESAGVLRQALEEAEADLRIYIQSLTATREAIEEAVVMVQEQRENFDFALDRFETLMPLVETGALEPLAASQIQSAYISARASLAQAKFFLGQARRDFGPEELRRRRLAEMQGRVESLRQRLGAGATVVSDAPEPADEGGARPIIEAYFQGNRAGPVVGQQAVVSLPNRKNTLRAQVTAVDAVEAAEGADPAKGAKETDGVDTPAVWLVLEEALPADVAAMERSALPVRVEIVPEQKNAPATKTPASDRAE
jgi:hypothetical protein